MLMNMNTYNYNIFWYLFTKCFILITFTYLIFSYLYRRNICNEFWHIKTTIFGIISYKVNILRKRKIIFLYT